jgi:type I restriction enzyme S subunit
MVWNEQLKREIPKGWVSGKLKNVVTIAGRSTSAGEHLKGKFYTPIDELPMKTMSFWGGLTYEEAKSSLQLYEKGNLLLGAMRVYFHRVCIAAQNGITRSTTIVLSPKKQKHLPFVFEVLNMESTIQYANKISVGTQQPYVNWDGALDSLSFALPPDDEVLDIYSEKVQNIVSTVMKNVKENYELTAIRDWLLPMLMTGQASVK